MTTFQKDPEAVLDYEFDWSDWLEDGETLSSRTVTVTSGLTKESDAITGGNAVTVWLSGGTAGSSYTVECKVTTSASRTDERSFTIRCRER